MAESTNLKTVITKFELTNLDVARATGIDPSLISRYVSGNRKLKRSSRQAGEIAEYLLTHADTADRIDWLREQFESVGLSMDITSVMAMKHNLIQWISQDGELGTEVYSELPEADEAAEEDKPIDRNKRLEFGAIPIAAALDEEFRNLSKDETVDFFLSSDRFCFFTNEVFAKLLHCMAAERSANINIVIGMSGDTKHFSEIIGTYMAEMVTGKIRFYTFFGATRSVAEQMFAIFRNNKVVIVTETSSGSAYPVGTFINDADFVREMSQSFDATYRYSQPLFNIYNDDYMRNMIEVLYTEYCLPGPLCVVKDSVNPMYMAFDAYCRVLRKENADDGEYTWKCNEYRRFNDSFESMLNNGMPCREIISLKRLNLIIKEKKCRMAGVYFLTRGFFDLDLQGCRDILIGYIEYLEKYPHFSLLILDDLPELHGSSCWHVKGTQSVSINDWSGMSPVLCQSGHGALVQEFQKHYETIWKRGSGSLSNRAYVISILRGVIKKMDAVLAEEEK
jgi:hypothetical protein